MNLKKLVLSLCISTAVLALGTSSVFAKNIPSRTKHVTINEYDMYKKMDKQKNIASTEKNSMVKNYIQSAQNLGKKDYKELKNLGYSDSKINLLKKASNSGLNESELKTIGSDLTFYGELESFDYDSKDNIDPASPTFKTIIGLSYYWSWNQIPIITNTDGLALNWYTTGNNKLQFDRTDDCIQYYDKPGIEGWKSSYHCSQMAKNNLNSTQNGLYITFPMYNKAKKLYALTGYSYDVLVNYTEKVTDFYTNGLYAQSTSTTSPEFIINNNNIQVSPNYSSVSNLMPASYHFTPNDVY